MPNVHQSQRLLGSEKNAGASIPNLDSLSLDFSAFPLNAPLRPAGGKVRCQSRNGTGMRAAGRTANTGGPVAAGRGGRRRAAGRLDGRRGKTWCPGQWVPLWRDAPVEGQRRPAPPAEQPQHELEPEAQPVCVSVFSRVRACARACIHVRARVRKRRRSACDAGKPGTDRHLLHITPCGERPAEDI